MNYSQIAILFLQGTLVSFAILLLFHYRKRFGIGMLFACLGLLQFMQVFVSNTISVSVTSNLIVSPGSTVLFTSTLFALLIIYIKEDASETRNIIYALFAVNIIMAIFLQTFEWNLKEGVYTPISYNGWVLFVGTIALFLDSLLIILIFEFIARRVHFLFLQISLTMLIVVTFDTFFFLIISFWGAENLKTIIISGLISKTISSLFYSVIFYFYLTVIDSIDDKPDIFIMKDLFKSMSFKQKFESVAHDIKKVKEEHATELVLSNKEKEERRGELTFANTKITIQKQELKNEKELNELKSRFVSTASHEFRTPLSAINFAAGSIKKYWAKMEPIMIENKLSKIENQVMHMTSLLDDILIVGQADAGKFKNNPLNMNLGVFLHAIIEEVSSSFKNTHEILIVDPEELKNSDFFIDEKLGRNIFTNLFSNAIKFSPNAKKVIVKLSSEKGYTIISITDFGIGISESEIKYIFNPFTRGKNVDLIQGTGLGLSIVKVTLDEIGGEVIVDSDIGKGTSFIIKIPSKLTP